MSRYIDADELKRRVEATFDMQDLYLPIHFFEVVDTMADEEETVDVAPVVHAHWIKCADGEFECSHCKGKAFASPSVSVEKVTKSYKHCFECGAKMDEEVKVI